MNQTIRVEIAKNKDIRIVVDFVVKLLCGFNRDNDKKFVVDEKLIETTTQKLICRDGFVALIAYDSYDKPVGLLTMTHAFAIYNGGDFGVITELYVDKEYRSLGVGKLLLEAVFNIANSKGWNKIEVTAPIGDEWARTRLFYKNNGYKEKGLKLRMDLNQ